MTLRAYAYGLTAAAVLTGGVAIYYSAAPGLYVTADDVAELAEGINERRAAISTNAHTITGAAWSFSVFTNLPNIPTHEGLALIMDQVTNLPPHFVKERTTTNVTMWTAPGLFQAAGIGPADGTQTLFTVAFTTNGLPIYSNRPALYPITNTFFECYRALALMTTTVAAAEWTGGPFWNTSTNPLPNINPVFWEYMTPTNKSEFYYASDGPHLTTNLPDWFIFNSTNYGNWYQWRAPGGDAAFLDAMKTKGLVHGLWTQTPGTLNIGTQYGWEEVSFEPRGPYQIAVLISEYPDPSMYMLHIHVHSGFGSDNAVHGQRFTPTNRVKLFGMASGVVARVDQAISFTGSVSSAQSAFAATNFSWATSITHEVTYSQGVVTGVAFRCAFDTGLVPDIHQLLPLDDFVGSTGDVIRARGEVRNPRPPVINWTFTRCK